MQRQLSFPLNPFSIPISPSIPEDRKIPTPIDRGFYTFYSVSCACAPTTTPSTDSRCQPSSLDCRPSSVADRPEVFLARQRCCAHDRSISSSDLPSVAGFSHFYFYFLYFYLFRLFFARGPLTVRSHTCACRLPFDRPLGHRFV
ncbi:hypothetical protein LY78DRAFT_211512 [Colletotrichum sublineola]|nr:hypothetical protein LY78DRAFT_211512 [Colletotrichum sublineola]